VGDNVEWHFRHDRQARPGCGADNEREYGFRIAAAPWTYRRVRQRIESPARENRVLPIAVDPRGTSRTCPACGKDDRRNRTGEMFQCIARDHKGDADFIGANVLTKTRAALGRMYVPGARNVRDSRKRFRADSYSPPALRTRVAMIGGRRSAAGTLQISKQSEES